MSAIQGIEGVISLLQATAMVACAGFTAATDHSAFAGQLHAALDRISDTQTAAARRQKNSPSVNPAWR